MRFDFSNGFETLALLIEWPNTPPATDGNNAVLFVRGQTIVSVMRVFNTLYASIS